jgi:hypothetical protein
MADNYLTGLLGSAQPDPRGEIKPTPRNKLMGLLADALAGANDYANKPGSAQGGLLNPPLAMLANALALPSLATTADRMSYGAPLTNARQANVPWLKPETADALMMAPLSPRNALAAASMGLGMADNGVMQAAGSFANRSRNLFGSISPELLARAQAELAAKSANKALAAPLLDDAGAAALYLHGTASKFKDFDLSHAGKVWGDNASKNALFFTADRSEAGHFADIARSRLGGNQRIVGANIHLSNPKDLGPQQLSEATRQWLKTLPEKERLAQMATKQYESNDGGISKPLEYAIMQAKARGHDGARVRLDDGTDWAVVFKPDAIRQVD